MAGLATLLLASGCITLTTVSIPQKTSLEHQLIGELEPLTEEEVLSSSVRAQSGTAALGVDDQQQRAIAARRRQLFHRDDVDELEAAGCLGEAQGARVVARPCAGAGDAGASERMTRLVQEENDDRRAIVDWAIAVDPVLTPNDRGQVLQVYGTLLADRARPGAWIEEAGGTWRQKPAAP